MYVFKEKINTISNTSKKVSLVQQSLILVEIDDYSYIRVGLEKKAADSMAGTMFIVR